MKRVVLKKAYVYAILVDGVVKYIGKGTGSRVYNHLKLAERINRRRVEGIKLKVLKVHNRLAKALRSGKTIVSEILLYNLSCDEAFQHETKIIASYPKAQLWNELSGGQGLSSEDAKRMWADPINIEKQKRARTKPKYIQKQRENTLKQFSDPEKVKQHSELSVELWKDLEFREKNIKAVQEGIAKPEAKAKHIAKVKERWEDPEQIEAQRVRSTEQINRPGRLELQKNIMLDCWSTPEFRAKCLAQWSDPECIAKRAANLTPEFLEKRGKAISEGHAQSEKVKKYNQERVFRKLKRQANLCCSVLGFGS